MLVLHFLTPHSFPGTKQQDLSPWEEDEEPHGPSLHSELTARPTMDINWKTIPWSSKQVHGTVQVRFIPGFCPFCSEKMLACLFFMCAMLQSLWQHFSSHLLIFTPLNQNYTKSRDFLINIH